MEIFCTPRADIFDVLSQRGSQGVLLQDRAKGNTGENY